MTVNAQDQEMFDTVSLTKSEEH